MKVQTHPLPGLATDRTWSKWPQYVMLMNHAIHPFTSTPRHSNRAEIWECAHWVCLCVCVCDWFLNGEENSTQQTGNRLKVNPWPIELWPFWNPPIPMSLRGQQWHTLFVTVKLHTPSMSYDFCSTFFPVLLHYNYRLIKHKDSLYS